MTFKPLLLIFLLILIQSCSSHSRRHSPKVIYSSSTEKSFQELERERVVERYRRLRRQSMENGTYVKKSPRKRFQRNVPRNSQAPAKPARYRSVNPGELDKEIEQNLAFHCMKKRKSKYFKNEVECYSFTQNIYFECKNSFNPDDRRLLKCVKRQLRY